MMKINQIWNELETDHSVSAGLLLRRYSANVLPNVFVALRHPEKQRALILKLSTAEKPDITVFSGLKDIAIEIITDDKQKDLFYLAILLLDSEHEDIFSVFCEDVVTAISNINEEKRVVNKFLNRIEKWRSLFDKASLSGLSPEEQRGLYGELYFLRKWLEHADNLQRCVKSWVGPEKAVRDFQLGDWGLEVKTTHGNNHQKVHISSERQLDTSTLNSLFLFHLSLESQQQNGETLNTIVDDILTKLSQDFASLRDFKTKLLHGGYYKHHSHLYEGIGYQIRDLAFYNIKDTFPRIEESDLRRGVGEVEYSIILSECTVFKTDAMTVFETIK